MKRLRYTVKLKKPKEGEEQTTFIRKFAITANPRMHIMGMAFSRTAPKEEQVMFFSDGVKMRVAAPAITPGVYVYENQKTGEEEEVEFTPENIEEMYADLMAHPERLPELFNDDHKEGTVMPCYLLESWIVEEPETDKALTKYGIKCPKGTVFFIYQYTDKDAYDKAVKNKATALSLEGNLGKELQMSEQKYACNYADVVVINDEGKALMLKRRADDEFEPGKWGFPGGKVELEEDINEAARREMLEETGITDEVRALDVMDNPDGSSTGYFVTNWGGQEPVVSEEHDGYKWMAPEEIAEAEVIKGENSRFSTLVTEAIEKLKTKPMKEGEVFEVGEGEEAKKFIIKDGVPVPYTEEEKVEMAEGEAEEEKPEGEEAAETAEAEAEQTTGVTEEKVEQMLDTKIGELKTELIEVINNSMQAAIEAAVKNQAPAKPEDEEEQAYSTTEKDSKEQRMTLPPKRGKATE